MKQVGGGKIINIGSMTSYFGASYASPYATSKGGIVQLSKSLALAWAADNIQVNALLPGWFETELTDGARASPRAVRARFGSHSGRPLGQAGGHCRDGDLAGEPCQRVRHRRRGPG
jgi:NAD(P)-dependent dehydrogenase (short-subunit alcohol dehydrogenase family)